MWNIALKESDFKENRRHYLDVSMAVLYGKAVAGDKKEYESDWRILLEAIFIRFRQEEQ